eukprot:CAMPEP_0173432866 /NCGR_PEP_ID=MMETSP1357-20121228/10512_1 /TAXON_ID=77926 /ORGANISM="Hemiselmis rufescens, Strain PCC563" /LENGTH=175 /DNA_ID=CAMNT_0014397525 /DNA_START=36 /DNA_END=563 /DNA_ORIENTATION=+
MAKAPMATPQAYFDTLAATAAVLLLKAFLVNMLIVRASLSASIARHPEDKNFPTRSFFSTVMVTFGPGTTSDFWNRCTNNLRNILENEPMFIIIAYVYGVVTVASPTATVLLKLFVVFRFIHMLCHIMLPAQPFRALAWLGATGISVFMAVQVLMLKGSLLALGSKDLSILKGEL